MRPALAAVLLCIGSAIYAQSPHPFPPDSLVNTRVIPHNTPVIQVVGAMRNFTSDLGVRCTFCHVGREGQPLEQYDFATDEKRSKQVAREMMLMVQEVNRRLDTLPGRTTPGLQVTCATCHRGVSRPVPLSALMFEAASAGGADSAIRAYRALHDRYYGRDAYDFAEGSLNVASFRLARANRINDGLALLEFNEGMFPASSGLAVFRGNILLMRGDTTAAAVAFREAVRRDSTNAEAKGRLQAIGQKPIRH